MKTREIKEKKAAHSVTIWLTGSLLFDNLGNQKTISTLSEKGKEFRQLSQEESVSRSETGLAYYRDQCPFQQVRNTGS